GSGCPFASTLSAWPEPFSLIQSPLLSPSAIPQGFTRFGSVIRAIPGRSEIKLVLVKLGAAAGAALEAVGTITSRAVARDPARNWVTRGVEVMAHRPRGCGDPTRPGPGIRFRLTAEHRGQPLVPRHLRSLQRRFGTVLVAHHGSANFDGLRCREGGVGWTLAIVGPRMLYYPPCVKATRLHSPLSSMRCMAGSSPSPGP